MKIIFDNSTLELTPIGKSYLVTMGDKTAEVEITHTDPEHGRIDIRLSASQSVPPSANPLQSPFTAYVSSDKDKRWVTINGRTTLLTKSSSTKRSGAKHDHSGELTAPMPGQVRAVNVSEGDAVTKGQTLMILEAMKMEIRIQSPSDGTVSKLFVKQGQTVEREQMLIRVESQKSNV